MYTGTTDLMHTGTTTAGGYYYSNCIYNYYSAQVEKSLFIDFMSLLLSHDAENIRVTFNNGFYNITWSKGYSIMNYPMWTLTTSETLPSLITTTDYTISASNDTCERIAEGTLNRLPDSVCAKL